MKNRYIEISKSRLSQFEDHIDWKKINQVIEFGSSYGDTLEDIGINKKIKNPIGFDLQKPQSKKIKFFKEDLVKSWTSDNVIPRCIRTCGLVKREAEQNVKVKI